MKKFNSIVLPIIGVSALLMTSCKDDDMNDEVMTDDMTMTEMMTDTMTETMTDMMMDTHSYSVTITNLTQGQPMSPFAVLAHDTGMAFTIGEPASMALEYLAEGGMTDMLTQLDWVDASVVSDQGMLAPGATVTLELNDVEMHSKYLSLTSMLVATNDGFTGINAVDVSTLMMGQSLTLMGKVYDSGTEVNSEMSGTLPGVDAGEGFNSERNDTNIVTMHPGVVSNDDGLNQSVLTSHHRFDNPAIKVVITKM